MGGGRGRRRRRDSGRRQLWSSSGGGGSGRGSDPSRGRVSSVPFPSSYTPSPSQVVPEYLRPAGFNKLKGPLKVKRLPSGAWEKWCKEGVVCFSMGGMDIEKVYFANPSRDRSIYHVADFVVWDSKYKCKRSPMLHIVACVLLESRIYMIGGKGVGPVADPTDVYYCDVATHTQLPGGGYEWISGPDLNSGKRMPYVFSLAGNIYGLSLVNRDHPFEVLKPNSCG